MVPRLLTLLLGWLQITGFFPTLPTHPRPKFSYFLEQLTKLRKHLHLPVYFESYNSGAATWEKMHRGRCGELVHSFRALSGCVRLLGFWCGHQPGSPPGSLVRVFSGGSWPRQDWRNHWPWWLNSVSHPSSLNGVEGMGLKVITLQSLDWSPDWFFWRPTPIQKFCRSQPPTPTSLI